MGKSGSSKPASRGRIDVARIVGMIDMARVVCAIEENMFRVDPDDRVDRTDRPDRVGGPADIL